MKGIAYGTRVNRPSVAKTIKRQSSVPDQHFCAESSRHHLGECHDEPWTFPVWSEPGITPECRKAWPLVEDVKLLHVCPAGEGPCLFDSPGGAGALDLFSVFFLIFPGRGFAWTGLQFPLAGIRQHLLV